jgi:hypothetical protein
VEGLVGAALLGDEFEQPLPERPTFAWFVGQVFLLVALGTVIAALLLSLLRG